MKDIKKTEELLIKEQREKLVREEIMPEIIKALKEKYLLAELRDALGLDGGWRWKTPEILKSESGMSFKRKKQKEA